MVLNKTLLLYQKTLSTPEKKVVCGGFYINFLSKHSENWLSCPSILPSPSHHPNSRPRSLMSETAAASLRWQSRAKSCSKYTVGYPQLSSTDSATLRFSCPDCPELTQCLHLHSDENIITLIAFSLRWTLARSCCRACCTRRAATRSRAWTTCRRPPASSSTM